MMNGRSRRTWRVGLSLAAMILLGAPAVRAATAEVPLGVRAGADEILRAGYEIERRWVDQDKVTVHVLRAGEIVASANATVDVTGVGEKPDRREPVMAEFRSRTISTP